MENIAYVRKRKSDINNVVIVHPFTYVQPHFVFPPIAAEYLQAGIVATGRKAILLDMRFETDIKSHLENADLVCLYGHFEDCSLFGKWKVHVISEVLAQIPDNTPVVAGGTGFSDPVQSLQAYRNIDVIIRGNPEFPMMELLKSGTPENVKNLVYRKGDEIVHSDTTNHSLSETIYPIRSLRNPKYNYHMGGTKIDLVRAAVGCNYWCRFCYRYGKDINGNFMKWQGRSAQSLFNEIKEIEAPFVGWVDDDMTTDMKTLEDLSNMLLEHNIHKLYMGTGRIDHVIKSSVATLKKMEKAGFLALSFGVESLKKETLAFYGKGQTLESIEKAMRMMNQTNILLICNFIFGSPAETEKDMMDMLWFGRKWHVDSLVTNRFRTPEGSPMHKLIHDPATGKLKPEFALIQGDELAEIKFRVKFAQRTPLALWLSLLKLYRHRGMFIDPMYFVCTAIETFTKHTRLEKSVLFRGWMTLSKKFYSLPFILHTSRFVAILLTPLVLGLTWVCDLLDRLLGISTAIIPRLCFFLEKKMYNKQRLRSQVRTSDA